MSCGGQKAGSSQEPGAPEAHLLSTDIVARKEVLLPDLPRHLNRFVMRLRRDIMLQTQIHCTHRPSRPVLKRIINVLHVQHQRDLSWALPQRI
eukprot:365554-Chlamydomonas_euryale.AAC.19